MGHAVQPHPTRNEAGWLMSHCDDSLQPQLGGFLDSSCLRAMTAAADTHRDEREGELDALQQVQGLVEGVEAGG